MSERMVEIQAARLETSLEALRRQLAKLDDEIAKTAEDLIRKRRYLVQVVWTVKDAIGEDHIDMQRELATDELRWATGMDPGMVNVLKAIREASRPQEDDDGAV